MAAKKKTKKKQLGRTAAKNGRSVKKTVRKKLTKKNASRTMKLSKKKPSLKKVGVKTKARSKKKAAAKTAGAARRRAPIGNQGLDAEAFSPQELRARSAGQSGDLQGLSNIEGADSESVDELLEEGNAFEADVVAGVQSVGDADEQEVRTHEVPEDDVPGEYLDKE